LNATITNASLFTSLHNVFTISAENIYPHYFKQNPDFSRFGNAGSGDESEAAALGLYSPNCGFDALSFSFGHDDYLASLLEHNGCTVNHGGLLPDEAAYVR